MLLGVRSPAKLETAIGQIPRFGKIGPHGPGKPGPSLLSYLFSKNLRKRDNNYWVAPEHRLGCRTAPLAGE